MFYYYPKFRKTAQIEKPITGWILDAYNGFWGILRIVPMWSVWILIDWSCGMVSGLWIEVDDSKSSSLCHYLEVTWRNHEVLVFVHFEMNCHILRWWKLLVSSCSNLMTPFQQNQVAQNRLIRMDWIFGCSFLLTWNLKDSLWLLEIHLQWEYYLWSNSSCFFQWLWLLVKIPLMKTRLIQVFSTGDILILKKWYKNPQA